MVIEKMIMEANFPARRILCDSIKFRVEFFMVPAFTPNSKVLREKDINAPAQ